MDLESVIQSKVSQKGKESRVLTCICGIWKNSPDEPSSPSQSFSKRLVGQFRGDPVVRTLNVDCGRLRSIPGWGTKILRALG